MAVHELLSVNDEVRELITRRGSEHAIRKAARNAGMRTLLEDGVLKASQGLTTLADVVRVVASEDSGGHKEEATRPEVAVSQTASSAPPAQNVEPTLAESANAPAGDSDGAPKAVSSAAKERVLVVEDSPTIASVVKYFLELEGFEVLVAKDGEAGLESARRDRPQAIVTDCNMPGMDGMNMVKG